MNELGARPVEESQYTKIFRIPLASMGNGGNGVSAFCDNQLAGGFKVVTSFVIGDDLLLMFQKKP